MQDSPPPGTEGLNLPLRVGLYAAGVTVFVMALRAALAAATA